MWPFPNHTVYCIWLIRTVKEVSELHQKAGINTMDCFKNEIIRAPRTSFSCPFFLRKNYLWHSSDKKFLKGNSWKKKDPQARSGLGRFECPRVDSSADLVMDQKDEMDERCNSDLSNGWIFQLTRRWIRELGQEMDQWSSQRVDSSVD